MLFDWSFSLFGRGDSSKLLISVTELAAVPPSVGTATDKRLASIKSNPLNAPIVLLGWGEQD